MTTYVDVFPVTPEALPKLFAYKIEVMSNDVSEIGGKLVYRLQSEFGGNWIWCGSQIVTDKEVQKEKIKAFLEKLSEPLNNVTGITPNSEWKPSPLDLSEFAARGLLANYKKEMRKALESETKTFSKIQIKRKYDLRGRVVGNKPAVSITISSYILHTQSLSEFAKGKDEQELIGMMVAVDGKDFKGTVSKIVGKIQECRKQLLDKSSDEETRNRIRQAPDDELTVNIRTRKGEYTYIASMLRPIVRMGDLDKKFGVKPVEIYKHLQLAPSHRYKLIRKIAKIGQDTKILEESFNSQSQKAIFLDSGSVNFRSQLRIGKNQIYSGDQSIYKSLTKHGLFSRSSKFPDETIPIKIGIVNALPNDYEGQSNNTYDFLKELKERMKKLHFSIESVRVGDQRQQKIREISWENLEKSVLNLKQGNPDIILALFPGKAQYNEWQDDDIENDNYHDFKCLTMQHDLPSQVIYEDTFSNQYAMDNIVLGILAKTGNVPFVLGESLPYADIAVGIDVARRIKQKLPGTVNAVAMTRVYGGNGQFIQYTINNLPIEGEEIPSNILRSLFPSEKFKKKTVVIHRDGPFRGNEKLALKKRANEIEAMFYLVEVIKSEVPRLYQMTTESNIDRPPKGSAFKLSDTEAFLVSSLPPFKGSMPHPLHIRTEPPFTIERAIHSVLSLTLLHYGSVREPRLPVTIHYSDKIGEFLLRGINPKTLEGNIPFWL